MVPLGLWDGKDSGTVVVLVGHGSPKDFPWSSWDMGVRRTSNGPLGTLGWEGQWDCGGLGGTWESRGLPVVPLGLWDVLTGLQDSDGKLGHHSSMGTHSF